MVLNIHYGVWYLNCQSTCIVFLKKHDITGKLRKSIWALQMLQHIAKFWANMRSHFVLNHSPYYLIQIVNDLERARLSRSRMILLLAHPLTPSPSSACKLDRRRDTQKDWEREKSCWRERGMEAESYKTGTKPDPLKIIQYSLNKSFGFQILDVQ